jgi:hypothetical protein
MKIRSLLLGSVAAAGLASSGFAADLGVVTSLDVCDELGISGLTISSDDNCLVIDGGVSMEYSIGDFLPAQSISDLDVVLGVNPADINVPDAGGVIDSALDIDAWLRFVATADSDFGPAKATIKLLSENLSTTPDPAVLLDEAWVSIGDTTVLMAGHKGSIFNDGDDKPLNYLGLFTSSKVDVGVGFRSAVPATGGNVIQVVSNLGNGVSIGGAIENLQSGTPAPITGVGVISYAGDGLSGHASFAVDQNSDWKVHTGFTGTWDPVSVVGAFAADSGGWWNALGSASATFDMFTLAVSGEATSGGEWGVGGSVSATVSEGVTVNLGSRWFDDTAGPGGAWQVEGGVSAAVTETITLTAAVGAIDGVSSPTIFYGKAGLAWAPGGGFTASVEGYANSDGGYKGTFKAAKTIK